MGDKPVADKLEEMLPYHDEKGGIMGVLPRKEIHSRGLLHKHVAYYVTNQDNHLLLQLRAADKAVNAGQWDKPGGHVGIDSCYSDEFLEEMCHGLHGISALIVPPEQFDEACKSADLSEKVVLTKLDTLLNYNARRVQKDGSVKIEVCHIELFRGRYDGPTDPQPGEVQQIRPWPRAELEKMIAQAPRVIGYDTHDMIRLYGDKIFSR